MNRLLQLLKTIRATMLVAVIAICAYRMDPFADRLEIHLQQTSTIGLLQLVGCHVLHWSAEHLCWDLGMFLVLGVLCEARMRGSYFALLCISAIAIPFAIMFFHPHIQTYRGLSGIDTAIFAMLVLSAIFDRLREGERGQAAIFLALFAFMMAKIAIEFYTEQILFVSQVNFAPLPISHLIGAMIGASIAMISQACTIIDRRPLLPSEAR